MRYEGNPKHKEPWQRGRRGSICLPEAHDRADELLESSELFGDKRYATFGDRAYCAQEHRQGAGHGYAVGWKEVPDSIRRRWVKQQIVRRQAIRKYWGGGLP